MKIIDPSIYIPAEYEYAFHHQPGIEDSSQWWYNSAILDNGYIFCLEWAIAGEMRGWSNLLVRDPEGIRTFLHYDYRFPEEMTVSTEHMEIKTSNSSYIGWFPRFEMHIEKGDELGADVVFESITQPVRQPPMGVYVGRLLPPTPQYMTYIVRLRNKVTGKLIVDGKEISVESEEGYCDHQWGNCSPMVISHSWYWNVLYLPEHTIVWNEAVCSEKLGYQRDKWMWVYNGEKPEKYLTGIDFYCEPGDIQLHEETGAFYPNKMVVYISNEEIQGTIIYRLKQILQSPVDMAEWLPNFNIKQEPRYFRILSDVHYDLNIDGQKVKGDKLEIQELGI